MPIHSMSVAAPAISIVVPVFNREKLLTQTLDSIAAQTMPAWECLVVDDGSTDNSMAMARDYAQKDGRFRLLQRREPLLPGGNDARNLGWQQASAPWVMFLDSDDLLHPEALAQRLAFAQSQPAGTELLLFHTLTFTEQPGDSQRIWNRMLPQENDHRLLLTRFVQQDMPWATAGALWAKSLLQRIGGWAPTLRVWQDWELHVRALYHKPQLAISMAPPDNYYRMDHGNSIAQGYHSKAYKQRSAAALEAAAITLADDPEMMHWLAQLAWRTHVYQPVTMGDITLTGWMLRNKRLLLLPRHTLLFRTAAYRLAGFGWRKKMIKGLGGRSIFTHTATPGTHMKLRLEDVTWQRLQAESKA